MKSKSFILFATLLFAGAAYSQEKEFVIPVEGYGDDSDATEAQTRDFIVQLWSKCKETTVTADGDQITITDRYQVTGWTDYTTTFFTSAIGHADVHAEDGELLLVCRPDEPDCLDQVVEGVGATRRSSHWFDRCPLETNSTINQAFKHLISLHDKTRPAPLF